jgi:hypothetical protein
LEHVEQTVSALVVHAELGYLPMTHELHPVHTRSAVAVHLEDRYVPAKHVFGEHTAQTVSCVEAPLGHWK